MKRSEANEGKDLTHFDQLDESRKEDSKGISCLVIKSETD